MALFQHVEPGSRACRTGQDRTLLSGVAAEGKGEDEPRLLRARGTAKAAMAGPAHIDAPVGGESAMLRRAAMCTTR